MRRLFKLVILFLIPLTIGTAAGETKKKIFWGPEIKSGRKGNIDEIVGEDQQGFFVRRSAEGSKINRGFIIEKYRHDSLDLIRSFEVEIPKMNKRYLKFEQLFMLKNKLLLFTSAWNKEKKEKTIFAHKIGEEGQLAPPLAIVNYRLARKDNQLYFNIIQSADKKHFCIYYVVPSLQAGGEKLTMITFNEEGVESWRHAVDLPYSPSNIAISDFQLGNDANFYLLAETFEEKEDEDRNRRLRNSSFQVFAYYHEEDDFRQFEIDLGYKWVSDLTHTVNRKGDLVIAGFYTNERGGSVAGTFYIAIDKTTQEVKAQNLEPFAKDVKLYFAKAQGSGNTPYGRFVLKHIVLRESGGMILTAESYRLWIITSQSPNGIIVTNYHYYFNDVVIVHFNPDGSTQWMTYIPKKQHTVNDQGRFSSYSLFARDNKLFFLYNDDPKNLNVVKGGKGRLRTMSNPRNAKAMLLILDEHGLFEFENPELGGTDCIIEPQLNFTSKFHKKGIIYGSHGNWYQFATLPLTKEDIP